MQITTENKAKKTLYLEQNPNIEMKIYSVSYQLNDNNHDYSGFLATLKGFNSWWQQTANSWLISTDYYTAESMRNVLSPYLSSSDKLFIVRVSLNVLGTTKTEYAGIGLLENENNWVKQNL